VPFRCGLQHLRSLPIFCEILVELRRPNLYLRINWLRSINLLLRAGTGQDRFTTSGKANLNLTLLQPRSSEFKL
jgi:hypothetical protein